VERKEELEKREEGMDLMVVVGALAGLACYEDLHWKKLYSSWYESSSATGFPRLYGAVIIVNLVIAGLTIIALGFKVSSARKNLTAEAKKNGDNEAELRFNVPKMQAEGKDSQYRQLRLNVSSKAICTRRASYM